MQNQWFSHSIYVDIETGEKLTPETAKNKTKYVITKTHKNVKKIKPNESRRYIEYTHECRSIKYKQLSIL